jgi:uncharacterized protein
MGTTLARSSPCWCRTTSGRSLAADPAGHRARGIRGSGADQDPGTGAGNIGRASRRPVILYIEMSAAAKLLVEEPASSRLAARLDDALEGRRRAAAEHAAGDRAAPALRARRAGPDRRDPPARSIRPGRDRPSFVPRGGLLPGRHLRNFDALHLAAALRIGADAMLTYDRRQAHAADAAGLPVLAPSPAHRDSAPNGGQWPAPDRDSAPNGEPSGSICTAQNLNSGILP